MFCFFYEATRGFIPPLARESSVTGYTLDTFPRKVLRTDRKELLPLIHFNDSYDFHLSPDIYIQPRRYKFEVNGIISTKLSVDRSIN